MNGAKNEDGSFFVPAGIAQALCGRRNRDSGSKVQAVSVPSSVEMPEFAEDGLRFDIARDDQRIVDIALRTFLR